MRPIHLSLINGTHSVVLCDPTRLAQPPVRYTDDLRFVTCLSCLSAHADDSAAMKRDIQTRVSRKGFAHKDN